MASVRSAVCSRSRSEKRSDVSIVPLEVTGEEEVEAEFVLAVEAEVELDDLPVFVLVFVFVPQAAMPSMRARLVARRTVFFRFF